MTETIGSVVVETAGERTRFRVSGFTGATVGWVACLVAMGLCAVPLLVAGSTGMAVGVIGVIAVAAATAGVVFVGYADRTRLVVARRELDIRRPRVPKPARVLPVSEPRISVDGARSWSLDDVRGVRVGHLLVETRSRRVHLYPVFVVLRDAVVELADSSVRDYSDRLAEAVVLALGRDASDVRDVESGILIGASVQILVGVLGGLVPGLLTIDFVARAEAFVGAGGASAWFPLEAALGLVLWAIGVRALTRRLVRRSVDERLAEVFGIDLSS